MSDVPLSKNQVKRAGKLLVEAHQKMELLPEREVEIATAWRASHAEPVAWLVEILQRRVDQPVAYRLKRLPQIISKLSRQRGMSLATMQDLAGYRVVVDSNTEIDSVIASVTNRTRPWYDVKTVTDYRDEGRADTGYRAVHIILIRADRLVELQIRSRRQHGWAEAVERAANRTGFALKDGDGPEQIVEYFKIASQSLRALDIGVKPDVEALRRFVVLQPTLLDHLRPAVSDEHFDISSQSDSSPKFILIYDPQTGERMNWIKAPSDPRAAAAKFAEWEKREPKYEVVLIGSDSAETIRFTHAHYFGKSSTVGPQRRKIGPLDDLDPHGILAEILKLARAAKRRGSA